MSLERAAEKVWKVFNGECLFWKWRGPRSLKFTVGYANVCEW